MDRVSPKVRSQMMSRVRAKNTAPEIYVRSRLHAAGHRFRLHRKDLPGKPDIVLPRFRLAVFVHGCFWHGHSCSKGKRPATNQEFWDAKLGNNVERDNANRMKLHLMGWKTRIIWQCEIEQSVTSLLQELKNWFKSDRPYCSENKS